MSEPRTPYGADLFPAATPADVSLAEQWTRNDWVWVVSFDVEKRNVDAVMKDVIR